MTQKPSDGGSGKGYQIPERKSQEQFSDYRPIPIVDIRTNTIIAFLVFAASLIVYIFTQARTTSFWDSGEYAACMSILGVPHPPGNPFYIIFGRAVIAVFGWFVSHAIIAAFISGLASAFAVMFTYLMTIKLVSMFKISKWDTVFAGVIAAFFTAFSFTFWMNAIEAEVYSGLVFFVNIIIWLILIWVEKSRDFSHQNILLLIVYLFFLGFGVHQTALQVAPAILFIVVYPLIHKSLQDKKFILKFFLYAAMLFIGYVVFDKIGQSRGLDALDKWAFAVIALGILYYELRDVIDRRVWLLGLFLVIVGVSSHLYLMVRAAERPFINEGHPSTWRAFSDYILREQYGDTSMFVRRGNMIQDQYGHHFLRYFGWQWFNVEVLSKWLSIPRQLISFIGNAIILFLGALGGIFHFRRNKHSFSYFASILILTTLVMVFVMNLSSNEVRDRDYFFVVAYNMWAVWLGIGALALVHLTREKSSKAASYAMIGLMVALPTVNFISQYHVHDRSNEFIALDYGLNFLNSLEENAIIFTNGDNDTFPLWYAQAVDDPFARDFEHTHPTRDVYPTPESKAAIATAMEFKTKYLKGIRKDVSVANLSLLNTPWYLRQLRDKEGILFNISDEQIDNLKPIVRPEPVIIPGSPTGPDMSFSINLPPTPSEDPQWRRSENFYRISDQMVWEIIRENFGKRPIYFAVTCESFIGFEQHTRNEGMVARVVHTRGRDQIDIPRLLANIEEIYQYRSIEDPRVYKDDNMIRLVMNYGAAFIRAATHYAEIGNLEKAMRLKERAMIFIDTELKLTDFYVHYYPAANEWDKLNDFIEREIFTHRDGARIYISFILAYLTEKNPERIVEYLKKGFLRYPSEDYFADFALRYALEFERDKEILSLLREVQGNTHYSLNDHISILQMTPAERKQALQEYEDTLDL